MSRELQDSLESRGSNTIALARKRGFPRTLLVPSLKPWLLLNETTETLEAGHHIGDIWPCHQGAYRLAQAKEDLVMGKAVYWAGAEEARTSSDDAPTLIPAKRGQNYIDLLTRGSFEELDFQEGQFRVTGGSATIAGLMLDIAYNDVSVETGVPEYLPPHIPYLTRIHFTSPLSVDLDVETDWHIQGNVFACQRQTLLDDQETSHPRLNTGLPVVPVEANEYFWLKVSGPATVQLKNDITEDTLKSNTDLVPWLGRNDRTNIEDVGKFEIFPRVWDSFAQLITRSIPDGGFTADSYVSAWLYGVTEL